MTSARVLCISSLTEQSHSPLRAHSLDNFWQRAHSLVAVAATVVEQNMFPQLMRSAAHGGRWWNTMICDLLRRGGISAPIVGIDLVTDGDVSHAFRYFERPYLVFGVRFRIHGIRRAE